MTHDDYNATGINAFARLEDLLQTRRDMIDMLVNIVDRSSDNKVTAYSSLKSARVHFDKAVLDELQQILDSHKAVGLLEKSQEPTKPQMTNEQKSIACEFRNSLHDFKSVAIPFLERQGNQRHIGLAKSFYHISNILFKDWKAQFKE